MHASSSASPPSTMPDVSRAAAAASSSSLRRLPPLTSASLALHHTRFSSWFPLYRRHSPKATILDLTTIQPDFLEWLDEDGLVLPVEVEEGARRSSGSSPASSLSGDDEEEDDDDDEAEARNFDGLNERIRRVIRDYDGAVFPKLDWSAPADAAWIVPGSTLRCTTPSDVYLLLKSSDFIAKDVVQLSELAKMPVSTTVADEEQGRSSSASMVRPHLILKKFFAMPTSHEFRCFVRGGHLVAISQRDVGTYFDHLQERDYQRRIVIAIRDFFDEVLKPANVQQPPPQSSASRHPFAIADFIFDAYMTRDLGRVFLVDVNPYLERTDGLLWSFDEVERRARRAWGEEVEYESEMELQEEANTLELLSSRLSQVGGGQDEVEGEEEEEEEEDDDDDDDMANTFVRIYTDGRPPTVLRETPTNSNTNSGTTTPRSEAGTLRRTRPRRRRLQPQHLPILRVLTSRAQAHQAFPTHARNMGPSDMVNLSEGKSIAEFASEWAGAVARGTVAEGGGERDSDDEDGSDDDDKPVAGR